MLVDSQRTQMRSEDSIANVPPWVTEVLAQIQEDAHATIADKRKVDVMEAACVVSLGGSFTNSCSVWKHLKH